MKQKYIETSIVRPTVHRKVLAFPKDVCHVEVSEKKNNAGSFCLEGSRKYNSTDNFITNSGF